MNIKRYIVKNKTFFYSLLLISFVGIRAEYSYVDKIRIGELGLNTGFVGARALYLSQTDPQSKVDQQLVASKMVPLFFVATDVFLRHSGNSSKNKDQALKVLEKVNKYNAWYSLRKQMGVITEGHVVKNPQATLQNALITEIVEPVVFLTADYAIGELGNAFSKTEAGKAIAQTIPEPHLKFVSENGKIFVAAAGSHLVGTAVNTEGMNKDSAVEFGLLAANHLAKQVVAEYVITPGLDRVMGSEDSTAKSVIKCVAMGILAFV